MPRHGWLIPSNINAPIGQGVCIQIPDDDTYRQQFWGALNELALWFNFALDDNHSGRLVADRWGDIIQTARERVEHGEPCTCPDCGAGAMLRQSPTDTCVIEVSYDCGDTWSTLANFHQCIAAVVGDQLQQMGDELVEKLRGLYDAGGLAGVAPDVIYDASSKDASRDIALCYAWVTIVRALMNAEKERRTNHWEFAESLATIMRDEAALLIPIAPPAAFVALVAEIIRGGASIMLQLIKQVPDNVLDDAAAQLEVACCARDAMAGATPTPAVFYAALDGCSLSGDSEILRQAIQPMLAVGDINLYVAFVTAWGDMVDRVETLGLGCPCDPCADMRITFPAPMKPNWRMITPSDFDVLGAIPVYGWPGAIDIVPGAQSVQPSSRGDITVDKDGSGFFCCTNAYSPSAYGGFFGYKLTGVVVEFDNDCTYDDVTIWTHGSGNSWSGTHAVILFDADDNVLAYQIKYSTGVQFPQTFWANKLFAIASTGGVRKMLIYAIRYFSEANCLDDDIALAIDNIYISLS